MPCETAVGACCPGDNNCPRRAISRAEAGGRLRRLPELYANLEVAAFELELANIVFFQELNQFLQLFDFIRRHESLVCIRVASNRWMPGSEPARPPG